MAAASCEAPATTLTAGLAFNITAATARHPWASSSLDALAAARDPVVLTGSPLVATWPALTEWSDLCSRCPRLGRVFRSPSNVFYHENPRKPLSELVSLSREGVNLTCAAFLRSLGDSTQHLYMSAPLDDDDVDNDLSDLLADVPGISQLHIGEAAPRPLTTNLWAGKGTVAEAHFDASHNLFVQVRGVKRFVLARPAIAHRLRFFPEPHPRDRHTQLRIDASGRLEAGADHLDHLPEGGPLPAQEAVLTPGDVLYVPPFTVHRVGTVDADGEAAAGEVSLSINVFSESFENKAAGAMAAAGLPPSVQQNAGVPPQNRVKLLASWLRHVIYAVLHGEGDDEEGGGEAASVEQTAAAFLAPQLEWRWGLLHEQIGCGGWKAESCPRDGGLPAPLLNEARAHAARVVAPLREAAVARALRPGVRELLLISYVELVSRTFVGHTRVCSFLRCLALETSWAPEEAYPGVRVHVN